MNQALLPPHLAIRRNRISSAAEATTHPATPEATVRDDTEVLRKRDEHATASGRADAVAARDRFVADRTSERHNTSPSAPFRDEGDDVSATPIGTGSWKLDRSYSHTARTQALPLFSLEETRSGLVRVEANGMTFRARVYGMDNNGPAIVMLHGFPGSSLMWDEAAKNAAAKGYRVLAYDQRGTSPGARPVGKDAYEIDDYLNDLDAMSEAVGFEDFHLVGHDVGAVVAWGGAMAFPQKVRSLNTLSIPNPQVLEIRPYVKAFSIPFAPEATLRFGRSSLFRKMLPQGRSPEENEEYRRIFSEPGSLTATLNFYRGVNKSVEYMKTQLNHKIVAPTHFTYGAGEGWVNDAYLAGQVERMDKNAPLTVSRVENAGDTGHFLVENQPKIVIDGLLAHIDRHR